MPERIVRTLSVTLDDGREVTQGQKVDLSTDQVKALDEAGLLVPKDFETWDEFHAFMQDAYRGGRGDITAAGRLQEARSGGIVPITDTPGDVGAYADWLRSDSPSAGQVVAAAEDEPVKAKALLEAENLVTGQKPRKSVEAKLTKIIDGE